MNSIHFLKRKEIDDHKWDDCIGSSSNSLPYAFSWYLDSVAENWDTVVLGDYETVMPLVWLRKFGIKCLYHPYYCQQLGVFGSDLGKKAQRELANYITQHFSYISINLNPVSQIIACILLNNAIKQKMRGTGTFSFCTGSINNINQSLLMEDNHRSG